MDYTICYLEVFDEETNQWEYVAESDDAEPINHWYNNLDPFFDRFNLSYLITAIENKEYLPFFTKYKGLPIDCSIPIVNAYNFYFYEIKMCQSASYSYLPELFDFDYNKTINLREISKKELKLLYPEIYESKKQIISQKEWLGEDFFIELNKTKQRFERYKNCRLIYFLYKIDLHKSLK